MARSKLNSNQLSFDFSFDTEEEKQIVKQLENINENIELITAPISELSDDDNPSTPKFQPIIPLTSINDDKFSAIGWLKDNITAIKIANNYAKTNEISDEDKQAVFPTPVAAGSLEIARLASIYLEGKGGYLSLGSTITGNGGWLINIKDPY
jgi:hypothetical protein